MKRGYVRRFGIRNLRTWLPVIVGCFIAVLAVGLAGLTSSYAAETRNYIGDPTCPSASFNINGVNVTLASGSYIQDQWQTQDKCRYTSGTWSTDIYPACPAGQSLEFRSGRDKCYTVTFTYNVNFVAGSGGTISNTATAVLYELNRINCTLASSSDVSTGGWYMANCAFGTAQYNIIANSGKLIDTISGCGGSISSDIFTTSPITANCTINVTFKDRTYNVTPSAGTGGSISPNTAQSVTHNSTKSFTITPNSGYVIKTVSGCGGSLSGSTYTTGAITSNCTVSASFGHTVSISKSGYGTVSPSTSQTVNHNATTSFTLTPATNYYISSASGCGGSLSGSTYTTGAISSDCTVSVNFSAATSGTSTGGMQRTR